MALAPAPSGWGGGALVRVLDGEPHSSIRKKYSVLIEKYSLASSMQKDTRRIIAVGSGFPTKQLRSTESLKLLNWSFRNTNTFEVSKKDDSILIETHLYRNIYCNAVSNTLYCTSFSLSRAFDYYPAVFFNGMTRDHYACMISAYCSKY